MCIRDRPYRVQIDEEKWIEADAVIISTGASAKWLGIPKEEQLATTGGGVSACAVCDGAFFRAKEVAIVGAGDTCLLYTSPSPRDRTRSRMPSSA